MKRINILLLAIFVVAFLLRFWGISFGLPYRYHPDEPQHVVEAANMLADRRLEPEIFNNPPFYKYILMAGDAGYFAWSRLSNRFETTSAFIESIAFDPSPLYFVGRLTSAFFGALTILVTYFIGKNAYNRRVGLMAAWFLAVAFPHVRDSHYAVNDALLVFLVAVSLLGSILILRSGARSGYFLGVVSAGLAFATKYTAAFTLIPLAYAHWFSPNQRFSSMGDKLRGLAQILLLTALSAIFGSPYFVLKPGIVYHDIVRSIYNYGNKGFEGWEIDPVGGYLFYPKIMWWGVGALLALIFIGIALAISRRKKVDILLISFPLVLYLFLGRQQMYFARFVLPALPALLVMAAAGMEAIMESTAGKNFGIKLPSSIRPFLMVILLLLVSVQPLLNSIRYDYLLTQKDTRTLAKEWIEANIPHGARMAVEWPHHSPALSSRKEPEPGSTRIYDVTIVGGKGLSDHTLEYYRQEGVDYLVTSSNIYNLSLADEKRDLHRKAFYASLSSQTKLIFEVTPTHGEIELPFVFDEVTGPIVALWQRERPGPTIRIYHLLSQEDGQVTGRMLDK